MNLKNSIKKTLKAIGKAIIISKMFILLCAVIIIFLIFLPSIIYFITVQDGEYREGDWTSTPYVASTYTKRATISQNGIQLTTTAQELWDEAIKKGNNINEYLKSPEQFEKLMNAEVVTQYPKISNGSNNVNMDGVIEFERHFTNGSVKKLIYTDNDSFNNMINNGDRNVLNYFTLDGNDSILIGTVDEERESLVGDDPKMDISEYTQTFNEDNKVGEGHYEKTVYKASTQKFNYKQYVQEFTMPYDYLWAFVVTSEDIDFALQLADLAYNSEITFSIYDKVNTTVNKDEYTYKRQTRIDTHAKVEARRNYNVSGYPNERYWVGETMPNYNSNYPADYGESVEYNVVHQTTIKKNTTENALTHANAWNVKLDKEYTYQAEKVDSDNSNTVSLEDVDYQELDGSPEIKINQDAENNTKARSLADEAKRYIEQHLPEDDNTSVNNTIANNTTNSTVNNTQTEKPEVFVDVKLVELRYYEHIINREVTSQSTTKSQNYVAGTETYVGKDDINSTEANFVKIFKDEKNYDATTKILGIDEWLFEILEINESTRNMVDLTKYLLYKATNVDYGVTEFNYDEMVKRKYINATGEIKGNSIQEKVWFMLKELGYSDIAAAGAMGNFHYESGSFNPSMIEAGYDENNGGIGICQWTNSGRGSEGRNTNLKRYAQSKGKDWRDEDIQVSFLRAELGGGGDASSYATVQLLDRREYYNNQYAYKDGWLNATSVENSTQGFCYSFERPNANAAAKSMSQRIAYAQEYLNRYSGVTVPENIDTDLTGDNKEKMQQMIDEAKRIANDDRYQYNQNLRDTEFYYDCSSLVSRLYLQYFNIPRLDYSGNAPHGTENIYNTCMANNNEVPMTDLKPGDILWTPGHAALYIGNGQTAEAFNSNDGIGIGSVGNRFTKAFRVIK